MFSKIKHKLFFLFLLFSSFSLLSILISTLLFQRKDNASEIVKSLDEIYILALKEFKLQQEFLTYEAINPKFFETGRSIKVTQHNALSADVFHKLDVLNAKNDIEKFHLDGFLEKFRGEFQQYKNTFNVVVAQIKRRGYKDYGIEGEMRNYVHLLMEEENLDQERILMLRRHEKDFIIRKENQYVARFNVESQELKDDIRSSRRLSEEEKQDVLKVLENYMQGFARLVAAEKVLGIREQSGLMLKLAQSMNSLEASIGRQKQIVKEVEAEVFEDLILTAVIMLVCLVALTFVLSYLAADTLTRPITNLTRYITDYVSSNFAKVPVLDERSTNDEITALMSNFSRMANEINTYVNSFREKVEERTAEINKQNIEILSQQKQITEQRDELAAKTEILEVQQKLVTEKNKSILDSIRYAERIQNAILPPAAVVEKALPDSFIYYQPRDIVSGDFYWVEEVTAPLLVSESPAPKTSRKKKSEEIVLEPSRKVLFAAVDCTGHGVPGALMSIIGYNSLNKIVLEKKLTSPAAILDELDREVKHTLRQRGTDSVKDGMDIALCSIDYTHNMLQFAGANNPLYIIRRGELMEIKGSKCPVGMYTAEAPVFVSHEIQLEKGDLLYIFSDGYSDQFGGPLSKKFKRKQFKQLLLTIHGKEMREQRQILKTVLEEWKGDYFQVDDILVMGVRIG